jgi:hypothetical protein
MELSQMREKLPSKPVVIAYAAGMATTPVLVYVLRKPLGRAIFPIIADEKLDEQLFQMMSERLNWRDLRDLKERRKREGNK